MGCGGSARHTARPPLHTYHVEPAPKRRDPVTQRVRVECAACRCGRSARTSRAARIPVATRSASAISTWRRTPRGGARRTVRRTSGAWPTGPGPTDRSPSHRHPRSRPGSTTAAPPPCSTRPRRSSTRPAARSAPRSRSSRRSQAAAASGPSVVAALTAFIETLAPGPTMSVDTPGTSQLPLRG